MNGKREAQSQRRTFRSDLYIEDEVIRTVLTFLRTAYKKIENDHAEGELIDWVMSYLEQKYGRVLKCEKCGCEIKVQNNKFRSRCPKCEREYRKEVQRVGNMSEEQREKKKQYARNSLAKMKESGIKWKQRIEELKNRGTAGKTQTAVNACVDAPIRRFSNDLVVRTGTLVRTKDVKFIDYIDSFISAITGKRMMIRVMSLMGTGGSDAQSVIDSNIIEPIKALTAPKEEAKS